MLLISIFYKHVTLTTLHLRLARDLRRTYVRVDISLGLWPVRDVDPVPKIENYCLDNF